MPQQFHPFEEVAPNLPVSSVMQSSEPTAPTDVVQESETRRYDVQAVQKIVALAQEMQTRHRETLSPEDIENLGSEIGVEPKFVRRALAHIEAQVSPAAKTISQKHAGEVSRFALTRRQKAAALVPAALYLSLMSFTFGMVRIGDNASFLIYILLPAILAACIDITGKSKRVGALGGGLLGAAVLICLFGNAASHQNQQPSFVDVLPALAVLLAAGTTLGAASAGIRQFVSRPRRKKRLRVRLLLETDGANPKTGDWV